MGRKKSTFTLDRPVHITIKSKDLENIVQVKTENPTGVKLTRAAIVRIAVAFLRKEMGEGIDTEELEAFFKEHK